MRISGTSIRRTWGFTLLELMMAVLIVGILSAIAYPNLSRLYYIYVLDGNTSNLSNDLRFVLNESISHKEIGLTNPSGAGETQYFPICYGVEFDDKYSYQLWCYVQDSGIWKRFSRVASDEPTYFSGGIYIQNWSGIVNFQDEDDGGKWKYRIMFNSRGEPTSNGVDILEPAKREIVMFSSTCAEIRHLIIDLNTGKPRVEQ